MEEPPKKKRTGNPNWYKGMKAPILNAHRFADTAQKLQQESLFIEGEAAKSDEQAEEQVLYREKLPPIEREKLPDALSKLVLDMYSIDADIVTLSKQDCNACYFRVRSALINLSADLSHFKAEIKRLIRDPRIAKKKRDRSEKS